VSGVFVGQPMDTAARSAAQSATPAHERIARMMFR
jgi:hypothetical protein